MAEKNPEYKEAIKKTLLYSSIFKYPLTYYQLLNYLIIKPKKELNMRSFQYELAKLIKKQYITVEDEKCYLPGVKYNDWKKGRRIAKTLIRKNKKVFSVLEKIPWVKFIGITGSVAAYNADSEADIDIFVITQKNRAWVTRGIFAFILKVILRNYVKKGIDPNIFLDESAMAWPKEGRNLYTANEIVRMYPIVDKENTYFKFLSKNRWVLGYLGNFKPYKNKGKGASDVKYQGEFLLNFLDNIAKVLQRIYMRNRITTEVVGKHFIHFNKNDSTNPILERYKEKISE